MSDNLTARVEALELAVKTIATARFEEAGHPFHGNQYTGGSSDDDDPTHAPNYAGPLSGIPLTRAMGDDDSGYIASVIQDTVLGEGAPAHVSNTDDWELGVAHGSNYVQNADDHVADSPEAMQDYARSQLEKIRDYGEEPDAPPAGEVSDPESYYEGLLGFADRWATETEQG